MAKTIFIFLLTQAFVISYTLNISVTNIDKNKKGKIVATIFKENERKLFPFGKAYSIKFNPKKSREEIFFRGLNKGEYAVVIYHDENINNLIDKNSFGLKEGVGYSNNYSYFPSFTKSQISINKDTLINIKIKY